MILPPKKAPGLMIAVGDEGADGDEVTIPTSILELSGPAPKEGDSVSFQVDGKVTKLDGESATIEIVKVNGEDLDEEGAESSSDEAAEPSDEDQMAGLKQAAQAEDQANYPQA